MAEAAEKNKGQGTIDSRTEHINNLTFDERVIKKIAGFAASEIPGILAMSGNLFSGFTDMLKSADDPTKGINVEVGKKQAAIDMKVVCEYGQNVPDIFDKVVESVCSAVREMTGLEVVEVNVHVADILTKEDFNRKKRVAKEEAERETLPTEEAPGDE